MYGFEDVSSELPGQVPHGTGGQRKWRRRSAASEEICKEKNSDLGLHFCPRLPILRGTSWGIGAKDGMTLKTQGWKPEIALPDVRELSALQLAYLGDTLHDLYARSLLISHRAPVGVMHRQAVHMVSAGAQAAMLEAIEEELTPEEADAARRGRNAQAKHAAPKHQDPADYQKATGLEALWGWLYVKGQEDRLDALMRLAFEKTEALWGSQN